MSDREFREMIRNFIIIAVVVIAWFVFIECMKEPINYNEENLQNVEWLESQNHNNVDFYCVD